MVKVISVSDESQIPLKGAVVIDFYATWCGPCKRIAPTYENLSESFPTIVFLKIDVDESADLAEKFNVSAMPTFLFLKNGVIVKRVEGADMPALEQGFSLLM